MAKDINIVVLSGRLTRDPEVRQTAGGTPVLGFGIAVNGSRPDGSGGWEDVANFFECAVFGRRADSLSAILRKGMAVTVSGELKYDSWDGPDGTKRSKVTVTAKDIALPPRAQAPQAPAQPQAQPQVPQAPQAPAYPPAGQYAPPAQQALYQQPAQQPAQQPQAPQAQLYDYDIPF